MPLLAAMTDQRRFAVVILAAGQGTRMRSDTHKVLHPIASRPLLLHLLDRVDGLGADKRIVVVGKGRDQVEEALDGGDGGPGVVVLASTPPDPLKYGRIILGQGDRIAKMVEFKDATEEERAVRLCNSGMMAVRVSDLFRWLAKVGN